MITFNLLVFFALLYVAFLFTVAFLAERRAARGRTAWLRSPLIYTLSLSIYCTAWTFYGAVGYAARSGLEYLTIYLGPSLVMFGWWGILRKLVRVGRAQRITSIADLISSRFGKSTGLGVLVTLIAIAAATPYIALQLQSIALSFAVFTGAEGEEGGFWATAFWSAVGLTLFTVLFGTRNLDVNERHHGVVMAIAVEAVVKLAALLAVGLFVVWGIGGGVQATLARIDASPIAHWDQSAGRWLGLTFLAGAAFLCLPRMFQVLVVENAEERHLATASWAFPLYVMLMSLFVVPIAVMGLERLPGTNPDLFVLTLPLAENREGIALLAFLGGFSSATSMVIVATIALATMVSNHIVVPIWLRSRSPGAQMSGDVRAVVLIARRLSIGGVLALGYVYFRFSGGGAALAAIGLISFVGAAQVLPALLGGLFWRGATRAGAATGLIVGASLWAWCLFLPSLGGVIPAGVMADGPFGLVWLRPEALFGIAGLDPLLHAILWSLLLNAGTFVTVSLCTFPTPMERLQGAQFVNVFQHSSAARALHAGAAQAEDLLIMAQRIVGAAEAQDFFQAAAVAQGKHGYLPDVTPDFIAALERELAGSVGAATAHAMMAQLTQGATVSVEDLIAVADEAAQIMEYSARLEAKSAEQERTARALREANDKLTRLGVQKDSFLSQISHELRTPMTSIRAFSEILREGGAEPDAVRRYAGIIEEETQRLTRLLDDLLDLSVLENGQGKLDMREGSLQRVIDRAVAAAGGRPGDPLVIQRREAAEAVPVFTDLDRLAQVFINLIANARKYCDAEQPVLQVRVRRRGSGAIEIDFADNGSGIAPEDQNLIFEKFSRAGDQSRAGGAGLGLAICREIMDRLGGSIAYLPGQGGAAFRVVLPARAARAA
ncbi:ATP-binding protein [Wenxinia marina]|nr:ATP-binding protein [Wenxinia marina]GGL65040.1 sodium:solute symporter [Wenxinia marina]